MRAMALWMITILLIMPLSGCLEQNVDISNQDESINLPIAKMSTNSNETSDEFSPQNVGECNSSLQHPLGDIQASALPGAYKWRRPMGFRISSDTFLARFSYQ